MNKYARFHRAETLMGYHKDFNSRVPPPPSFTEKNGEQNNYPRILITNNVEGDVRVYYYFILWPWKLKGVRLDTVHSSSIIFIGCCLTCSLVINVASNLSFHHVYLMRISWWCYKLYLSFYLRILWSAIKEHVLNWCQVRLRCTIKNAPFCLFLSLYV